MAHQKHNAAKNAQWVQRLQECQCVVLSYVTVHKDSSKTCKFIAAYYTGPSVSI